MVKFVLARLVQSVLALIGVSFIVFAIGRATGSPADTLLPIDIPPSERKAYIDRLGLDKPLPSQYLIYLGDIARGDFGTSLRNKLPVTVLVADPLLNSLKLATVAMMLAIFVSFPLGVFAAVHRDSIWDRAAMTLALLGQSVPPFWLGSLAVLAFAVYLPIFPTSGTGGLGHYVLPALTLGWVAAAGIVRLLRSSMLEVLDSEYMRCARAKGLQEHIVTWRHGVPNALITVVTFVGFTYALLIASALTVEVVFNWPGLGRLTYQSILLRDYPLLQFSVLIIASISIGINFLVDVSYAMLDPRVRA